MGVNKVEIMENGKARTIMDLTGDTVTPEALAEGYTAHNATGEPIAGEMKTTTVLYTEQNLTTEQKAQARDNIDATGVYVGSGDMPAGYNIQIDPDGAFDVGAMVTRKEFNQLQEEIADETTARKQAIEDVKVQMNQVSLNFAEGDTVEESLAWLEKNGDTSLPYILPDNYFYKYKKTLVVGKGYTNQVPLSTDADGSIYNGKGFKNDVRLSSSGSVSGTAQNGSVTTGFIPFTKNTDVIRMKGAVWLNAYTTYGGHWYLSFYDSNKSLINEGGIAESAYEDSFATQLSVVYDETTNVTTFKLVDPDSITGLASRLRNKVSYFRINAYGKGEDLIITVNEEIKEATTTEAYAWTNTGRAFVPADYEDRIVELENTTSEHEESIEELKNKVNDIMNGNTDIVASTKFDATVYGLPVLYLVGDTSPIAINKDNKVTLDYVYGEHSGTCTLKGQGATSYKNAQALVNAGKAGKFNYTIKFDTAFEVSDGWGEQQKYCLKANFIDHTHSRNVVSAKLWGKLVKSRTTQNANLSGLVNGGAVDGFPIVIILNGEFHGLYTFNIPKDGWMFGLVEDATKTQAFLGANQHTSATQFKGEVAGDESDFELEFVSDEDNADWVTPSLNRLINACINSNGTDLDTTVAQYLDWDSAIDYLIHVVILRGSDMVDKNYLLTTFDGTKWMFTAYDMDSTFGLEWDGSQLSRPVTNYDFGACANSNRVFELIKLYKKSKLKARYAELRQDILSESRICQMFENFAWVIPSSILVEDVKKYPTIQGSSVNGIDQICRWVRQRLEVCDKWIDEL